MSKNRKKSALLIIDMINTLDFSEGDKLLKQAMPVAENILSLKKKLKDKGVPAIYVNDHYGHWRSSWQEVYAECSKSSYRGHKLSQMLKPEKDDYFILKPKHSGFYSSNLEILLDELEVEHLIMTGIAGNICVLFTANDAHMRGYDIHVPGNCIASNTKKDNDYTLRQLKEVLGINTDPL